MENSSAGSLPPNARYWAYLREGRFMLQRSRVTGKYVFYPRLLCPETGSSDLEFTEVDGRGTVHSTTVVRRKASAGGDYNVALIDLDVGVRVPGRVVGIPPTEVKIGIKVKSSIEKVEFGTYAGSDQPIIIFRPE